MYEPIKQMLQKYPCHTEQDYLNALKEIFQEIALLGLWRAKFYEHAAFYGGSALRILYGLDRFSEDLDFTLLKSNKKFNLAFYNQAIVDELSSYGFEVKIIYKVKNIQTPIESAFIKADTKKQLLEIEMPADIVKKFHRMHTLKIKMEVDTDPPGKFSTEAKTLLQPIPFSVNALALPDLFSGKIHALLCRPWVKRVKGRDWYDFVWYMARKVPVNLIHLKERLVQSDAWPIKRKLTIEDVRTLLNQKIAETDFNQAKKDVLPFVRDPASVGLWSRTFFESLLTGMAN